MLRRDKGISFNHVADSYKLKNADGKRVEITLVKLVAFGKRVEMLMYLYWFKTVYP